MNNTEYSDRILGCLYGKAIGDALGLGSEFMNKTEIREIYPNGYYQDMKIFYKIVVGIDGKRELGQMIQT